MESKPSREEVEKLMAKLAESPVLFARISSLVGELCAEKGGTLDEAEERVVKSIREAGREVLKGWMEASAQALPRPVGARRGAKKSPLPDDFGRSGGVGADMAAGHPKPAPAFGATGRVGAGMFEAIAAGLDRLRSKRGVCGSGG